MKTFQSRVGTAVLLGVVFLGLSVVPTQAQFRVRQWGVYAPGINPNAPFYNRANPFQYVAPGVSLQSALINTMNTGQASSFIPPYLLGYNPYPPIYTGPNFGGSGYNPYFNSAISTPLYNPYMSTGFYGGGYPGYGSTPGTGAFPGGGYGSTLSTGYNPYTPFIGSGGMLQGGADVIFAEGRFMMDTEKTRLLRTQWKVAELDYKKKLFDYDQYVRANTPTFAETQEKLANDLARRMRNTAMVGEIWSGQAQNVLLKDFAKNQLKKVSVTDITLPEEVLKKINVTSKGTNMGLLRNGGELSWPVALSELAHKDKDLKRDIDLQARELYRQAEQTGKVDPATAKDLRTNIKTLRDRLVNQVNNIPTDQYANSKEFLSNLDEAIRSVERGDAPSFFAFQKFIRDGNRTVQAVVEYMLERGLTFAPMVDGDESAYQALYQAMAAYNIAMNDQLRTTVSARP